MHGLETIIRLNKEEAEKAKEKKMNKQQWYYVYEGDVFKDLDELSDFLAAKVIDLYPEIVHSDFIAEESYEFEQLWDDVLKYYGEPERHFELYDNDGYELEFDEENDNE